MRVTHYHSEGEGAILQDAALEGKVKRVAHNPNEAITDREFQYGFLKGF